MPKVFISQAKLTVKENLKTWFQVLDESDKTVKCTVQGCTRDASNPFKFVSSRGWYKFERHLIEVHKISPELIKRTVQKSDEVIENYMVINPNKITSKDCYTRKDSRQVRFETALVDYVVVDSVPLDTPSKKGFKNLIATLDPRLKIPSRRTITRKINESASKIKSSQKLLLSRIAEGHLHLSLDLWTSISNRSVLSMKAQFITEEWERMTVCFKHFKYTKSGHNLRNFVKSCLSEDLGVNPVQVGSVMADNASENVKAFDLREFQVDTQTTYDDDSDEHSDSANEEESGDESVAGSEHEDTNNRDENHEIDDIDLSEILIDWSSSKFQRLGCTAHALQLVLKEVVMKNSRGKEIVDTILQIVRFFHHSPRYSAKLKKLTSLCVVSPGSTRWNSVIFALKRLLKPGFIDAVNTTILKARLEKPGKRTTTPTIMPCMQEEMLQLYTLLHPFIELSDKLQADGVTSSCIIPGIIATYKVANLEIRDEQMKRIQMNICLGLTERFGAADEKNYRGRGAKKQLLKVFDQKLYILSTLLDPRYKTMPFEVNLPEPYNMDTYRISKANAIVVLNEEFKKVVSDLNEVTVVNNNTDQLLSQQPVKLPDSIFDHLFMNEIQNNDDHICPPVEQSLEIGSYINEKKVPLTTNPLLYWRQNATKYPHLARIAKRVLAVPASSGGVERVFSVAGAISRSRRSTLSLSNLECLLLTREEKKNLNSFTK